MRGCFAEFSAVDERRFRRSDEGKKKRGELLFVEKIILINE